MIYLMKTIHTPLYIFVDLLLQVGAYNDVQDRALFTPLYAAAQNDHTYIVERLLQARADKNIKDRNSFAPLNVAVYKGNVAAARALLRVKVNKDIQNDGGSPLSIALQRAGMKVWLIFYLRFSSVNKSIKSRNGLTPLYLDVQDDNNFTPLTQPLKMGIQPVVDILLQKGASTNIKTKNGFTPLYAATDQGYEVIVALL